MEVPPVAFEHVLSTIVDENNILWIFTSDHDTRSYQIHKTEQGVTLTPNNLFKHDGKLLWAFAEDHLVYFIDDTYSLYEYNFNNQQEYYIADLKTEIESRGEVSSIIKQQTDSIKIHGRPESEVPDAIHRNTFGNLLPDER